MLRAHFTLSFPLLGVLLLFGCRPGEPGATPAALELTLAAYTTPREVYQRKLLPAFAEQYRKQTGVALTFKTSFQGSGAQTRAILSGFDADIAALSLESDVAQLRAARLIRHDDRTFSPQLPAGIVSRSVVALGVRKGNPKQIRSWDDLTKPGVEVLTPNPKTSGGALWNLAAIYGAALRGHTAAPAADASAARALVDAILANVKIMDRGARESLVNFERGAGDVVITYENELLLGRSNGQDYEIVLPSSTILIENPIALLDVNVDRHQTRAAAEAFLRFLGTPEAQAAFADYGFRPVDERAFAAAKDKFGAVRDLFTVADLGGFGAVQERLLSPSAPIARGRAE